LTNAEQFAKDVDAPPMKALITLSFLIIFGWLAVVTFCGPELARAINGPEPVKAKAVIRRHR
jgi:hypothetical protein